MTIRERASSWLHQELDDLADYSKTSWKPLIYSIVLYWIIAQIAIWLAQPIETIYLP